MDSIFNHPPSIAEDTLQYIVYPSLEDTSSEVLCAALGARIEVMIHELLPKSFLWHRDAFELKVLPCLAHEISSSASTSSHEKKWKLEGRMRVGDSINDEWCLVWLWKELTKTLDIAVSIFDSDGEFLLIEAAESLPAWVSPSNAENRVWLYQSHLHVIPIYYVSQAKTPRMRRKLSGVNGEDMDEASTDNGDDGYLGIGDALPLLRDPTVDSVAPEEVEVLVWERISRYPEAAHQHTHRCKAYLPRDIVAALSVEPSLIQRAVETFYTRDAIQLRAVHNMSRFPPSTSILATVHMTRPGYAQLVGQRFHPPKAFGRWVAKEGTPEWKRRDIGMKIACGFEMLYAESKTRGLTQDAAWSGQNIAATKGALKRDKEYRQYLESLQKVSYFGDEIEGSSRWDTMETRAAMMWLDMHQKDELTRRPFAQAVNEAISRAVPTANDAITEPQSDLGEDSDAWLNVDEEMLDGMLHGYPGRPENASKSLAPDALKNRDEDQGAGAQAKRLHKLAGKVRHFVEGEGGLDGAQFEDDLLSDEEFSDEEESRSSDHTMSDSDVEEAKKRAAERLVPPLSAAEYGMMPPSYSNSQPVSTPTEATETVSTAGDLDTQRTIRKPILLRDKYEGVDSDDESDPGDDDIGQNLDEIGENESEEDRPVVVGEIEIDMAAEQEEFLKFSRDALGITQDQWDAILQDRSQRGAFIPASAEAMAPIQPEQSHKPNSLDKASNSRETQTQSAQPQIPNLALGSFEAVMQAMDEALQLYKGSKSNSRSPSAAPGGSRDKGKGKSQQPPVPDLAEEDQNIEEAMAAELRAALETESDSEGENATGEDAEIDYKLIKNFLQSFKAQGGLAGPVSSLAGRLEGGRVWSLPRDSS